MEDENKCTKSESSQATELSGAHGVDHAFYCWIYLIHLDMLCAWKNTLTIQFFEEFEEFEFEATSACLIIFSVFSHLNEICKMDLN